MRDYQPNTQTQAPFRAAGTPAVLDNPQLSFESIRISKFKNAKATVPIDTNMAAMLEAIRAGTYAEQTRIARDLFLKWKKETNGTLGKCQQACEYDAHKKTLPAFTVSGAFKKRNAIGLVKHSGLLQVDLDKLSNLAAVRDRMRADPHVAFGFVSPSGEGLKLGVPIDGSRHPESYLAVEAYFRDSHGISIDQACKDVTRLCFVSHDPDLWINPGAAPIPVTQVGQRPVSYSTTSYILHHSIPTSLDNCITTSLHHRHDDEVILENIKDRDGALLSLQSRPQLARIYTILVESRFQAIPHSRNNFLTRAVPFLYRAVATRLVLDLVGSFYDCNRSLFNDPRAKHMKEASAMLDGVVQTYVGELSTAERGIYTALKGHDQDVFRICRDLALLPNPPRGPLTFYLAFGHLADRLEIHSMTAQRIMRQLEILGLIQLLEKGTMRAPGVRGKGGTYIWKPQPPQPSHS